MGTGAGAETAVGAGVGKDRGDCCPGGRGVGGAGVGVRGAGVALCFGVVGGGAAGLGGCADGAMASTGGGVTLGGVVLHPASTTRPAINATREHTGRTIGLLSCARPTTGYRVSPQCQEQGQFREAHTVNVAMQFTETAHEIGDAGREVAPLRLNRSRARDLTRLASARLRLPAEPVLRVRWGEPCRQPVGGLMASMIDGRTASAYARRYGAVAPAWPGAHGTPCGMLRRWHTSPRRDAESGYSANHLAGSADSYLLSGGSAWSCVS